MPTSSNLNQRQSELHARAVVAAMQAYQPGKPVSEAQRELGIEQFIKLASNENPLGPSPVVAKAIADAIPEIHRYPDANGFYLKRKLAEHHGVAEECITLGAGSNEILELVASAFLDHESSAVYSEYAFLVYALAVARSGATAIVTPAVNFAHDALAIADAVTADTKVIYLANPNNPTGTYINHQSFIALLNKVPASVLVVLDEAYAEYVECGDYPDGVSLLADYPNLLVTRTFSKAYGLGGMRVGYSMSTPEVADLLNRVRPPFNVSALSLVAAEAALQDDDYLQRSVATNRAGMDQLIQGFSKIGVDAIDSIANFITVKVGDAAAVNASLLQQGVIVRPVANYVMPDHLRITIGLEQENARLLEVLGSIVGSGS